jgi:prophage regulatory protein
MATPNENLLPLRDVIARVGIQKSQIYKLVDLSEFPRPIRLSYKASRWVESEINVWIENKIKQRDEELEKENKDDDEEDDQ